MVSRCAWNEHFSKMSQKFGTQLSTRTPTPLAGGYQLCVEHVPLKPKLGRTLHVLLNMAFALTRLHNLAD